MFAVVCLVKCGGVESLIERSKVVSALLLYSSDALWGCCCGFGRGAGGIYKNTTGRTHGMRRYFVRWLVQAGCLQEQRILSQNGRPIPRAGFA